MSTCLYYSVYNITSQLCCIRVPQKKKTLSIDSLTPRTLKLKQLCEILITIHSFSTYTDSVSHSDIKIWSTKIRIIHIYTFFLAVVYLIWTVKNIHNFVSKVLSMCAKYYYYIFLIQLPVAAECSSVVLHWCSSTLIVCSCSRGLSVIPTKDNQKSIQLLKKHQDQNNVKKKKH